MSAGQGIGAVAGGIVGAVLAAPTGGLSLWAGTALGGSIGMSVGGLLDPPKGPSQPGPQINDKNFQGASYGAMVPRVYGTIAQFGNLIWLEGNKLKATVRKKKQGGKGGGSKATVKTVTYSATFAISFCRGPVAGVRRIWCGDKLIYNAGSDDLETIIASNQAATGFRIYLGTDDQLPDPRIEAEKGPGNAPAHRGEMYIVFYDFQLADYGNTLQGAQFKVEVVTAKTNALQASTNALPFLASWSGLAKSPYRALAVSASSSLGALTRDFVTWEPFSIAECVDIVYTGAFFCALSATGATRTSSNGDSWEIGSIGAGSDWSALATGDGVLCAVEHNSNRAAVSGNGRSWSVVSLPAVREWVAISYGAGRFVAVAANSDKYAVSTDGGQTWAEHTLPISSDWLGIVYSGSVFCAVSHFSGTQFLRSTDLVTWEQVDNPSVLTVWGSVTGADGHLFAVGESDGFVSKVAHSEDGRDWELYDAPAENWWATLNEGGALYGVAPGVLALSAFITLTNESVPLADIVEDEVALSSLLTTADVDTSLLTAQVRGFRVSGGSIRSALEPLQGAFPFDIIQSGYQIKAIPRGQGSVLSIPREDLGASEGDSPGDLLQESREMDSQLPALVSIKYLDASREYATGEQSKARISTQAINRVDRELPLVLTADEAAGVADILVNLPWLERSEYAFSLPPPYLALEPGDVVTANAPWATYELRLTEINYAPGGRLECKARPNRAALYTSTAKGGEGVPPTGVIPLAGESLFLLLDLPVVDETVQDAPGAVGVMTGYTPGWPGGVAFRSLDDGQTWSDIQAYQGKATVGKASGTLPASAGTHIDQRSLTVKLISGELEGVTRDQMLAGLNYAAYGAPGRWEVVRFQNATLQGDGSYLVSGFVRGERGTEWATGLHQVGDWFVLLDDPDNAFIDMAVGSIGVASTFRGVTSGASIDSASDVPFTYHGVNLECLSPVAARGVRDGSGNFSGSFTRRSRLSSSWWTTGVPAPVGETAEAYEIDVMSGSTVLRTIASSTPSFSYSAANQTTDFGSVQAAITFRIYQLSATVGRGYPLEVTL